jgi:hypothetical protein
MKRPNLQQMMFGLLIIGALNVSGMFLIESHYANNPQVPDPAIGRTIPVPIRLHGVVYLTPSENLPRAWCIGILEGCVVSIIALWTWDWIRRRRRP